MTRKQIVEEKKKPLIEQWVGIYRREYEMYRAYGYSNESAMNKARIAVDEVYAEACKRRPQDKMFFLDIRIATMDIQYMIVQEAENSKLLTTV